MCICVVLLWVHLFINFNDNLIFKCYTFLSNYFVENKTKVCPVGGRLSINKPQISMKFCKTLIEWRNTNYFEKIHKAMCLVDYIVAVRLQKKTVKLQFRAATDKVSNRIQRGKSSSVDLCCTPRIDHILGLRD